MYVSLSLSRKNKHSGFTLIELMVVMAIIAILATAGLSAYTGYLKKARDAVRIADMDAINKIVIASMSATGMPPKPSEIRALVTAANNGVRLQDPLYPKSLCMSGLGAQECVYYYKLCDGQTGYMILDRLESPANTSLLVPGYWADVYDVGSCKVQCNDTLCGTGWDWQAT